MEARSAGSLAQLPALALQGVAPARRLLWCWAPVVALALLAPSVAGVQALAPVLAAMLVLVAAVDAVRGARGMRATSIVAAVNVIRLTEGRTGILPLRLIAPRPGAWELTFPESCLEPCGVPRSTITCAVQPPESVCEVPLHPQRRGVFAAWTVRAGLRSPLGLWTLLGATRLELEVRVYPDWRRGWRTVLASPLRQFLSGDRVQLATGAGREFERLRDYLPGDAYQDVAWRASARRSTPVTRLYQWEQSQPVVVAVDHARLAGIGLGGGRLQLDLWIDAALVLAAACQQCGDELALATFADQVTGWLAPASGRAQFRRARELLLDLQPEPVNPDFAAVFAELAARVRRRALFLILTDISEAGVAATLTEAVSVLSRTHLVSIHSLLPAGAAPLGAPGATPVSTLAGIYQRLAGHRLYARLQTTRRGLHQRGVDACSVPPGAFLLQAAGAYADAKRSLRL